jgi:hypothetical protein
LPLSPAFVEPGQGGHVVLPPGTPVHRILAVFGEVKRDGRWLQEPAVRITSVFGNVELDFSTVLVPRSRTTVKATAVFASVTLLVSQQTRVRILGHGILGDFTGPSYAEDGPADAPLLLVDGKAVLATIQVKVKGAVGEKKGVRFNLKLETDKNPAAEAEPSMRQASPPKKTGGAGRSRRALPAE